MGPCVFVSSAGVVLLSFALAGCGAPFRDHTADPIAGTLTVETMDQPRPPQAPYLIQPRDTLSIQFYRNPELNQEAVVRPDGMISLPFIDDVQAAGISPKQLGDDIESRYHGELTAPDVTVIVKTFGAQRVFVGGEVKTPGELDLGAGLSVFEAVTKAGGFLSSARPTQVILIRRGPDGRPRGTSLDLTTVTSGLQPEQDVRLEAYDIVHVPKSAVGNVNTFVELYISRNLPTAGLSPLFLAVGS